MGLVRSLALGAALMLAPMAAGAQEIVKLSIVDYSLPAPLGKTPGDAAAGRKVVTTRNLGNCVSCHEIEALRSEEFHGEIGPALAGVASRYSEAQLRLILANPKELFPETVMPAFYRNDGLSRVRPEFVGKTILTAQQVDDVVAYLKTMN